MQAYTVGCHCCKIGMHCKNIMYTVYIMDKRTSAPQMLYTDTHSISYKQCEAASPQSHTMLLTPYAQQHIVIIYANSVLEWETPSDNAVGNPVRSQSESITICIYNFDMMEKLLQTAHHTTECAQLPHASSSCSGGVAPAFPPLPPSLSSSQPLPPSIPPSSSPTTPFATHTSSMTCSRAIAAKPLYA